MIRRLATKDIMRIATSAYPSNCVLSLLFILFLKTDAFNSHNHSCNPGDLRALYGFSRGLDAQINQWPVAVANSTSCCSWPGVHCALFSSSPTSSSSSTLNSTLLTAIRVVGLDLPGKGLEGVLSRSLAGLDKLSFLNLSHNSFRDPIPPELFHLKLLKVLDVSSNQLTGELPPGIGNLSGLQHLDVSGNRFTGTIPDEFHGLAKLEVFSATSNAFVGPLPSSLSSCSMLTLLNLWNNSLEGNIDLDCRRLVHLATLNLGWNRLQGVVPEVLSSCKALQILNLSLNKLSGQVPHKLQDLLSLSYLNLHGNSLSNISGALRVLQECQNLTVLILTKNFVGEEMPINAIRGFRNIRALAIINSALTGSLPSWLRNCRELRFLDLSWNRLTGEIARWFGEFDHLFFMNLSNNSICGEIPVSLTALRSLTLGVSLHENVSSFQPPFFNWYRGGQNNLLRVYKHYTDFPPTLNFSRNKMSGSICKEFGKMKYLHVLDLSKNNVSGSIPEEVSSMFNLERLDLSFNDLSGSIPSSITKLNFLSFFSVAYNHLQGLIPGGQFLSFPCSSFEGNPGLHSDSKVFCNSTLGATYPSEGDNDEDKFVLEGLPFAIGLTLGFLPTVYLVMCCRGHGYYYD